MIPFFPPQWRQIFWIPFNKPANWMSTKSHNKKSIFRVVYFPLPDLKYQKREGGKDHHMLNYTLSWAIELHSFRKTISFMGSSYCSRWLKAWDPMVCLVLGPFLFLLSSPCTISASPGFQLPLPLMTPESVPVLTTSFWSFLLFSEVLIRKTPPPGCL